MKRVHLFFLIVFLLSLLSSCHPYRIIEIETYNPSTLTFPKEIKTVMIVNNSAQQPDNVGHRYESNTKGDSVVSVSADSMAYIFCMSLGKTIADSPLFSDVRICEDTLRRDSLYYNTEIFKPDEVKSFCADYGVDALISLDKLFFSTVDRERTKLFLSESSRDIYVQITGELRVLWPDQKEIYIIPFIDSLSWYYDDVVISENALKVVIEPDTRFAMLYLSDITGQKMQVNIVPFWSEDKRWYYTNINSDWKQGTVFARAEKWSEAANVWEPLLEKNKKWEQKARLALNIALCYEMKGDFKKAIEFAETSYKLFEKHTSENDAFYGMHKTYIDILNKRMEGDKLISKQLRE